MLPGKNGFEIARDVRSRGIETPILMLTARGEVTDRVVGLEYGADDYPTKPFEFIELLARIRALLRRANSGTKEERPSRRRRIRELASRLSERAGISRNNELVGLSSKEMQLLRFFIENEGVALTRDELLEAVWEYDTMTSTRTSRRSCRAPAAETRIGAKPTEIDLYSAWSRIPVRKLRERMKKQEEYLRTGCGPRVAKPLVRPRASRVRSCGLARSFPLGAR